MGKLYIANTTQQVQDFQARIPEISQIVRVVVPIGGQVPIPMELNPLQIEAIVEQHSRYGLVAVSEIDRTKDFIGLCFQVDKPINVERVKYAAVHNFEVLEKRGDQIRKEAAVSVSNAVEEQTKQIGSLDLKAMEFSVEEVESSSRAKELELQTVRVDRNANPDGTPKAGSTPRGRGRRSA
jgi:hypothetical protein